MSQSETSDLNHLRGLGEASEEVLSKIIEQLSGFEAEWMVLEFLYG